LQRVTGWRNLDWVGVFVLFLAINWGGVCNWATVNYMFKSFLNMFFLLF
jgi:hypothetical protein